MQVDLDNTKDMQALDSGDMTGAIAGLGKQLRQAVAIAGESGLPDEWYPFSFSDILILGMGGSAIGGELVMELFSDEVPVPVNVNRDYAIPAYVSPDSLVIACSYSGNTEETLIACEQAVQRRARIMAITTGGRLDEMARENGWPVITIPKGMSPRAALGYSLVPLVMTGSRLGLWNEGRDAIAEAADVLETMNREIGPEIPVEDNVAKQIAIDMYGKIPVIYGSGGWRSVAAYRWKCQFNENAKNLAYHNGFPEMNHNEIVGWQAAPCILKDVRIVILRDRYDRPEIARRIEVTREILSECAGGVRQLTSRGQSKLARLLSLIYVGDYVSLYLAFLNQIDPTPIARIDYLKQRLAGE